MLKKKKSCLRQRDAEGAGELNGSRRAEMRNKDLVKNDMTDAAEGTFVI